MKKLTDNATKLRELLPKAYKIKQDGMNVFVERNLKDCSWKHANDVFYGALKKVKHLDEVGAGTGFTKRDWHLIDKDIEKKLLADTKKLHHAVAAYLKTWKDAVIYSDDAADMCESIQTMMCRIG